MLQDELLEEEEDALVQDLLPHLPRMMGEAELDHGEHVKIGEGAGDERERPARQRSRRCSVR